MPPGSYYRSGIIKARPQVKEAAEKYALDQRVDYSQAR